MTRATIIILILLVGPTLGCEDRSDNAAVTDQKSTFDLVRDDLPKWMEFAATEQLESASLKDEIHRTVSELESLELRHVSVMRALYGARAYRPMWLDLTGAGGLSQPGKQLSDALDSAGSTHGLDTESLHAPTVAALADGTRKRVSSPFEAVRFEAAELRLVGDWAAANPTSSPEELARILARRDGPAPRLAELIEKRSRELQGDSRTRVRLDLYLTDALVEYGMKMRWSNRAWYRDFPWPDHLVTPANDTRLGWDDLRRERRNLVARKELAPVFTKPGELAVFLAALTPPFEQYSRLTEAFEEYADIVQKGGWPALPDGVGELAVGHDSDAVVKLKARLAAEGYWKGDVSAKFTPSLAEAVRDYQRTHQLWEKGTLSRETRASLNVPAERRLAQIRVSLQRWRESNIGPDTHYLFVNIPDFHVEAWREGKLEQRIKTVVGATTHERDPDSGAFEYVHSTPSVSSRVEHVVLNPYWWVPADIVKKEIEPEIAKNAWYLSENNYEWAEDDRGDAALRQQPGDNNALGRVKINFPNDHQIYMHDTPDKSLFRWPARAFSHGCIRLERPMELAKYLLEQDGQWNEAMVTTHLDAGAEKWIKLSAPLPIHVEYYVVRVDDLGRANFLSDLYRRDGRRITGALAIGEKSTDTSPVRTVD